MNYVQVSLIDMINIYGEEFCKNFLQNFSSIKNKDVQNYLREQSIDFAKQNVSVTFIVLDLMRTGKDMLVGYFTLTNKSVLVNKVSGAMKKRIKKFATKSDGANGYQIPMPLIAQLGKNSSVEDNNLAGGDLLKMALEKVSSAQRIIGGKTTYIECESEPKLFNFYSENNFIKFGEIDSASRNTKLVQMLLYM